MRAYTRVAQLRTASAFRDYLKTCGASLEFDEGLLAGADSPMGQPYALGDRTIGNRFAVLPMEGWDGTADGRPTDLTTRRWKRFGLSGAKLIFGGEAVAAGTDSRGNPNGLVLTGATQKDLAALLATLVRTHEVNFGSSDDLLVGMQLSHAGRSARQEEAGTARSLPPSHS